MADKPPDMVVQCSVVIGLIFGRPLTTDQNIIQTSLKKKKQGLSSHIFHYFLAEK